MKLNGKRLYETDSVKYLGILIDKSKPDMEAIDQSCDCLAKQGQC